MDNTALREGTLRELIDAGSIRKVRVIGEQNGYAISVNAGGKQRTLATSRGSVRLFTLSAASSYLKKFGIEFFEVDNSKHTGGRLRKARPDRSEAMKLTRTTYKQQSLV